MPPNECQNGGTLADVCSARLRRITYGKSCVMDVVQPHSYWCRPTATGDQVARYSRSDGASRLAFTVDKFPLPEGRSRRDTQCDRRSIYGSRIWDYIFSVMHATRRRRTPHHAWRLMARL